MEFIQGNSSGYLLYDPYILGYDSSLLKVINGLEPTVVSGKIRISAESGLLPTQVASLFTVMGGNLRMSVTIPVAPINGTASEMGYRSFANNIKDSAYFNIQDDAFSAITTDKDGHVQSTAIPWVAYWTARDLIYEIRMDKNRVVFLINNVVVADHYSGADVGGTLTDVPRKAMLHLYLSNEAVSNLDISSIEIREARDIVMMKDFSDKFIFDSLGNLNVTLGTALDKGNDSVTTYEAGWNATLVDLSVDADVVVTASPAYLKGYTVDTAMSAQDALIKDSATTKFTVPASSVAGFDRDARGTTFATNITVESNDLATGKILIFWRAI